MWVQNYIMQDWAQGEYLEATLEKVANWTWQFQKTGYLGYPRELLQLYERAWCLLWYSLSHFQTNEHYDMLGLIISFCQVSSLLSSMDKNTEKETIKKSHFFFFFTYNLF